MRTAAEYRALSEQYRKEVSGTFGQRMRDSLIELSESYAHMADTIEANESLVRTIKNTPKSENQ